MKDLSTRYASDEDYTGMDNTTLMGLLYVYLLHALRCATKILLSTERDAESIFTESGRIAQSPTVENTYPLFRLSRNKRVIEYLIEWKIKRIVIEREITRRLERYSFSNDLLAYEDRCLGDKWIDPMFNSIMDAGRNKPWVSYENWQDEHDVKLLAVDAAVEIHNKLRKQYNVIPPKMRLPALPADLNMPVNDPSPFDKFYPAWFFWRVSETMKRLLPALDGTLEDIGPKGARTEVETQGRAVRRATSVLLDTSVESVEMRDSRIDDINGETIRATIPRVGDKYLDGKPVKPYSPAGIDPILNNPFPLPEDAFELRDRERDRAKVKEAIERTALQYNVKAKKYLKLLADNLTQKEAAEKVGVDPSTGRRWELAFKNNFKK